MEGVIAMDRFEYAETLFVHEDVILHQIKADIRQRGMPEIFVSPMIGALLNWLVQVRRPQNALEIGALGGYSGVWLARGLPPEGRLTSLELSPEYVDVARANLARAGFGDRVDYRVGPALSSLKQLQDEGRRFDFFFIDADKENYPHYLEWALRLANPGAIITADNALQNGRVHTASHHEPSTEAMRRFNQMAAEHPQLRSLLIPLGDGLLVAEVVNV